jgi:tetratricopeptide (TPR) repeat protein
LEELETARKHAERALKILSDAGIPAMVCMAHWLLGMVHLDSGDLKNARSSMEEALRLAQNNNEKMMEGVSRATLGGILGKADTAQGGKAEECILQGIKILDELKLKPWSSQGYLVLGELYTDMGQKERALQTLKEAEYMFREMGMDYWLRRTQSVLERLQT